MSKNSNKPGLRAVLSSATVGFLTSSRQAHSAASKKKAAVAEKASSDPQQQHQTAPGLTESIRAFRTFLTTTGIDLEINETLSLKLLPRLGLLSQIQSQLNIRNDRRDLSAITNPQRRTVLLHQNVPTAREALRYMWYATAVYGKDMIAAAQIGKKKHPKDTTKNDASQNNKKTTLDWISDHIQIPPEDIVVLDVDYHEETNHNHLRHFVALDHASKQVILSIRGTFTLSEIVVDITAFTQPCSFGGEAHTEIYSMAQRILHAVGPTLQQLLHDHEGYELLLTGHSLGGGCACVMNMMCQHDPTLLGQQGQKIRCIVFACPPLYTDLDLIPQAVATTTNYILEQDVVPFLSVDSVRHVFQCVRIIEDYMQTNMTATARMNLTLGNAKPPSGMIDAVHQASGMRLPPKEGAPVLSIPAAANIWMKERPHCYQGGGEYDFDICDSTILSWLGLNVDVRYFQYHLPPRYEHALEYLMDEI